jgi:hypothetical protein
MGVFEEDPVYEDLPPDEQAEFRRAVREHAREVSSEYNTTAAWYLSRKSKEWGMNKAKDTWDAYTTRSADYYEWASGWKIVWDDRVGRFRDVETGRFTKPPYKPTR